MYPRDLQIKTCATEGHDTEDEVLLYFHLDIYSKYTLNLPSYCFIFLPDAKFIFD